MVFCHCGISLGEEEFSMDKRSLSERDICTKYITPALREAGWDELNQIREEVSFTKGRIIVRGKLVSRGKGKRADYILSVKPNIPIAIIEAKENAQAISAGLQQGLEYAKTLEIPFVFSSNGDGFVLHLASPMRRRDFGKKCYFNANTLIDFNAQELASDSY